MFILHEVDMNTDFHSVLCQFIGLCLGVGQCKRNIGHKPYLRQKVHLNGRSSVCFAMWTVSILLYLNAHGHIVHLNFFSFVSPVKPTNHIINTRKGENPHTLYRLRYCIESTWSYGSDYTHVKLRRMRPPLRLPQSTTMKFHRK